ncbi:MAG: DUF6671 family protein [Bacteroidia bacterium]
MARHLKKLFAGRDLVVATMHGKERIMGSLLEKKLGVRVIIPDDLNTDEYGTFSGERERPLSQPETARLKLAEAMRRTGADLGIASEGAFQPHHQYFFATADYELLLLRDEKAGAEWQSWEVTMHTQAVSHRFSSPQELLKLSKQLQFPSHAVIVKAIAPGGGFLFLEKGITTKYGLLQAAEMALKVSADGSAVIENDLRAHMNPTRQKAILQAARRLINNLNAVCPSCQWPRFTSDEKIPGLPCSLCGAATRLTQHELFRCLRCNYYEKRNREDGLVAADPKDCDRCNP